MTRRALLGSVVLVLGCLAAVALGELLVELYGPGGALGE